VCCRYESLLFLLMYAAYITLMYFNRSIEAWIVPKFPCLGHDSRLTSGDMKLQKALSCDSLSVNNNGRTEIDIDTDNASKFTFAFSFFFKFVRICYVKQFLH